MRSRWWSFLAALVVLASVTAFPAQAQPTQLSQVEQVRSMTEGLADDPFPAKPTQWLDVGVAIPVSTFDDRDWDPGLVLRWNQQIWSWETFAITGSLGLLFNEDTRFNEVQEDASFDAGTGTFLPVESRHHVGIPFSMQFHIEPAANQGLSPFVSAGPAIQFTRESHVERDWFQIIRTGEDANFFVIPSVTNPSPALLADRALNKDRFHPGYVINAGVRAKVGQGMRPLHMRILASFNSWYERDRPISVISGMLSFGR